MYSKNNMVVIDDLEPIEATRIVNFLTESISNGDLDLAIQDCITKYMEVKFHNFKAGEIDTWKCSQKFNGVRCGKTKDDTIHTMEIIK